jgi:hypothetical protein
VNTKLTETALLESKISKDGAILSASASTDMYPMPKDVTCPETARKHFDLLEGPIDQRVFHPLLLSLKDSNPLLYAEVLRHPLLSGQEHKKRKKKRKERDRDSQEVKSQDAKSQDVKAMEASANSGSGRESSHIHSSKSQDARSSIQKFQPDYSLPPMSREEISENVSRVLARAIKDSSLQTLLLAVKIVMCAVFENPKNSKGIPSVDPSVTYLPLGTHLSVLFGGPAPKAEVVCKPSMTETSPIPPVCKVTTSGAATSVEGGSDKSEILPSLGTVSNVTESDMQLTDDANEAYMDDDLIAQAIALSLGSEVGFDSALSDGRSDSFVEDAATAGDAAKTNETEHEINNASVETATRSDQDQTEVETNSEEINSKAPHSGNEDLGGQAEGESTKKTVSTLIVEAATTRLEGSQTPTRLETDMNGSVSPSCSVSLESEPSAFEIELGDGKVETKEIPKLLHAEF